jgi:hypothetical protein
LATVICTLPFSYIQLFSPQGQGFGVCYLSRIRKRQDIAGRTAGRAAITSTCMREQFCGSTPLHSPSMPSPDGRCAALTGGHGMHRTCRRGEKPVSPPAGRTRSWTIGSSGDRCRSRVVAMGPPIDMPVAMVIPATVVVVANNHDRRRRDHRRRRDIGYGRRWWWRRGRTASQNTKAEKTKQRQTFHEHLPIRNLAFRIVRENQEEGKQTRGLLELARAPGGSDLRGNGVNWVRAKGRYSPASNGST